MIKCLISEHSLNKNLKTIFKNPIKFRRHLTVIDYISYYINGIYNGNGISQIKLSEVNNDFEDPIIIDVEQDLEKFKNNLKTINPNNSNVPYIEFKHSDFIRATNSKIKDTELKKILEDLYTMPINIDFPVCLIDKKSCGDSLKKIKKCEFKKQIKNETIINKFECVKHGKFDYKYKVVLDSEFMLYLINNIIMRHSAIIPVEMYNCTNMPTSSQIFMRRFIYTNNWKKVGPKDIKLKYDTIRFETGFYKSNGYIRSHMLKPLINSNYIKAFYNNSSSIAIVQFLKNGPYIRRFKIG